MTPLVYFDTLALYQEQAARDKCTNMRISATGATLAAQSSGKCVDLFRLRDSATARKKHKRRLKREREKLAKSGKRGGEDQDMLVRDTGPEYSKWMDSTTPAAGGEDDEDQDKGGLVDVSGMILSDLLESTGVIRSAAKTRGACFTPAAPMKAGGASGQRSSGAAETLLVSLVDNRLEFYGVPLPPKLVSVNDKDTSCNGLKVEKSIDHSGHRSDVRAVAISSDGQLIASASSEGVKFWSASRHACLRSCECGYGISLVFAPGGQYVVVGTKEGSLIVVDIVSGSITYTEEEAHKAEIWDLSVRPDGTGLMSCSGDGMVKFWDFEMIDQDGGSKVLELAQSRELAMNHDAMCCTYSKTKDNDKLMLAVGLLDNTIKVFYDDSLKFFLSLYGHRLPVTCVDISTDGTLLISGSADKTVKIWGLDFGDCHRSLMGHQDTVTSITFQPDTHYFFSGDKAGGLKYWDADR